jgi:hypothetical protein
VVQVPLTLSRWEVKVQAAPSARPAQAAVASAFTRVGEQKRGAVPVGPVVQVPAIVAPSRPARVQASSAASPVQASTATWGGLRTRRHTSVVLEASVPQAPCSVSSPSLSVAEHESPFALPEHASTMACGGAGGLGAQAIVVPSTVARQVPATVVTPSDAVSEHASVAAFPPQASICVCDGAQMSVPEVDVSATMALESADAVDPEIGSLLWLQANTDPNSAAAMTVFIVLPMPDGTESAAIVFLTPRSLG